jgi:hypoxanthine phosphoribosyltransferase
VWRGGTPVAIAMHEYFAWRGLALEHFPVKTSSYAGLDEHSGRVEIDLPEALAQHLDADQRLLIVDDVFDTGLSMAALLGCLRSAAGMRYPGLPSP